MLDPVRASVSVRQMQQAMVVIDDQAYPNIRKSALKPKCGISSSDRRAAGLRTPLSHEFIGQAEGDLRRDLPYPLLPH
jgi:hypothetical protein